MTEEISEIIGQLVQNIDTTINGTFNAGTGLTEYCDTKWARTGKTVVDDLGNEFLIDNVVTDESLEVTSLNVPAQTLDGLTFLPGPFYISGTKLAANSEWSKFSADLTTKTPLIWLLEIIRETWFGKGDAREYETTLRMFFLDETNIADYYTQDHRREVVKPMQKLAKAFIDVVEQNRQFKTLEDYTFITFSRFGVEQDNGMFENILDANLSGVELQFTLTKYKAGCKIC